MFQGYCFFRYLGPDRNLRDRFAGHPHCDLWGEFCAEFDQPAFDPGYPTMSLAEFEPPLRAFLTSPKPSIYKAD